MEWIEELLETYNNIELHRDVEFEGKIRKINKELERQALEDINNGLIVDESSEWK